MTVQILLLVIWKNSSNAINSAVEQGWAEDTLLRLVQSYNDASNQGNFINSIDALSPTALADLKLTLGLRFEC